MTDKIVGQGFRPADTAGARRTESARPARSDSRESGASSTASSGDTVNLTRSGLLLSKLQEAMHVRPAADSERVSAIKQALAAGTYEIDDQAVADKLLRFERELLA